MAIEDKIREIEEELHKTVYNKATQHHIGKLKAKLAQLREEDLKRKSSGKKGTGFSVKKSGDATVVLVGFPSVGKSTLLNQLTNADSKVGSYAFTTLDVVPGMMEYAGTRIQVLDIPGIVMGASKGKGRGREILSIVRNADLILIMLDAANIKHLRAIERELYNVGLRMNTQPPRGNVRRTDRGGVVLLSKLKPKKINLQTIRDILNVYGIHNAQVTLHEDMDEDRFIDLVLKNRVYIPSIVVLNKMDMMEKEEIESLKKKLDYDVVAISAEKGMNIEELKDEIFKKLGVIRVYTRNQSDKTVDEEPMILKDGSTVRDACLAVHRDMLGKFKHALVSGRSAKFDQQIVGLGHVLKDGDVLMIVTNR